MYTELLFYETELTSESLEISNFRVLLCTLNSYQDRKSLRNSRQNSDLILFIWKVLCSFLHIFSLHESSLLILQPQSISDLRRKLTGALLYFSTQVGRTEKDCSYKQF
jgi:hypothetical protein